MNLPNMFTSKEALVFEQGSDDGLYVSTDVGVYFTNRKRILSHDPDSLNFDDPDDLANNTAGWVRVGDGLPHTTCSAIEINYATNRLRTGYYGRGLWEHGLHCPEVPSYAETGVYSASDFLEAENEITSTAILPAGLSMKYRAGTEVRLSDGFHATAGSTFHAFIHPCDYTGNSFDPKNALAEDNAQNRTPGTMIPSLLVSPNPSSGVFMAKLSDHSPGTGSLTLWVFDAQGKAVCTLPYVHNGTLVDLQGRSGLFAISVHGHNWRCNAKVLVE